MQKLLYSMFIYWGNFATVIDGQTSHFCFAHYKQLVLWLILQAELQLEFCCALAPRMLFNNLDDDGNSVAQVEQSNTCNTVKK